MANLTPEEAQNIRNALPGASDAEIAEVLAKWDAAVMGPPEADVVDYPDPAAQFITKMAHALAAFWTVRTKRLNATIDELQRMNGNQAVTIGTLSTQIDELRATNDSLTAQVKALDAEAKRWKGLADTYVQRISKAQTNLNDAQLALKG